MLPIAPSIIKNDNASSACSMDQHQTGSGMHILHGIIVLQSLSTVSDFICGIVTVIILGNNKAIQYSFLVIPSSL
jgi:hypothetical protein